MLKKQPGDHVGRHPASGHARAAASRSITPPCGCCSTPTMHPDAEMQRLDVRQGLDAFERVLPGVADTERILSRSSSLNGSEPRHPTSPSIMPALGPAAALSRS